MSSRVLFFLILFVWTILYSCQRQELEEPSHFTALLPVAINWDNSGIMPTKTDEQNKVHRVSFRFFPKDGSEPFEVYLETDVYSGEIEVPIGEYSILVMNESVSDIYWDDYYTFSDVNDYNKISARVVDDNPAKYDFYNPSSDEAFMVEAHKLASWSMDDFTVTRDMVTRTRAAKTKSEKSEFTLDVEMRRLTSDMSVVVQVKNLKSSQLIRGAMRGFSQKVYLASAKRDQLSAVQFFTMNGRKFNEGSTTDGTTEIIFRTLGLLPESEQSNYTKMLDVILINGVRYEPEEPFEWDLTDELNVQTKLEYNIEVSIELPEVHGDIDVGDWEDDEIVIIT